jgi:serine phosphatase RsbU (regulator of sigma subunit)
MNGREGRQAGHLWAVSDPAFDRRGLRYAMSSVDPVSGDLLFSVSLPDGGQRILVGDLAGHGPEAAAWAPLLARAFYDHAREAAPAIATLERLNGILRQIGAAEIFLAYGLVEWNPRRDEVRIWNGALPGLIRVTEGGKLDRLPSLGMPLGVVGQLQLASEGRSVTMGVKDRLYLFTDGMNEATDTAGQPLGVETVEGLLAQGRRADELTSLVTGLRQRLGRDFHDDLTLVELRP